MNGVRRDTISIGPLPMATKGLEAAMIRAHTPYRILGGNAFLSSDEAGETFDCCRATIPHDNEAFFRLAAYVSSAGKIIGDSIY